MGRIDHRIVRGGEAGDDRGRGIGDLEGEHGIRGEKPERVAGLGPELEGVRGGGRGREGEVQKVRRPPGPVGAEGDRTQPDEGEVRDREVVRGADLEGERLA